MQLLLTDLERFKMKNGKFIKSDIGIIKRPFLQVKKH